MLQTQATQRLMNEHNVIERALELLERAVVRIRRGRSLPDGFASWIIEFFRAFADRCHHRKEEEVLFPLLQRRGIARDGGPIGVMLQEHTIGRDCIDKMQQATAHGRCDDQAFADAADTYTSLLRQHIFKENNILFPMADRCFSDEDDSRVMDAFQRLESGHRHDQWIAELRWWEGQLHWQDLDDRGAHDSGDDYANVIDSYHRCEDSGGFFDTFYEIFFGMSPEIPPKFAHTDMEKQKQVVMASLLWVLRLYKGDPIARREVEQLAESHSRRRHDVRPALYQLWLDALCQSVAKHDPQYTPQLQAQWRRVMQPGIELMQSKY